MRPDPHRSATRLTTCWFCKRERPASTRFCTACGPPIVVRVVHDALYGGLTGALLALVAFLGLWFTHHLTAELQLAIFWSPAFTALVGAIVGLVASIAWRIRARRWLKQAPHLAH